MKAETKAKRRVTLSIAGLGWLDETELETVKGAVTGASDTPVATIHDAVLDDRVAPATEPPEVTAHMDGLRPARQASAKPPAGPGVADIPADVLESIRAILTRVVALYPGEKADPTVLEDRKNMLHAVFGREIDSGMAGLRQLAALGREALRDGLGKLERMAPQAPPTDAPTVDDDGRPVHPDIKATAELLASLKARAARVGVSAEALHDWLREHEIPRTVEGEAILSPIERGRLTGAFNEALVELKRTKTPASKSSRRKAESGD